MEESEYIEIEEASQKYHWSRPMLYKFRKQGKLTFYHRPGTRQTLLRRSDLDELSQPRPKT